MVIAISTTWHCEFSIYFRVSLFLSGRYLSTTNPRNLLTIITQWIWYLRYM